MNWYVNEQEKENIMSKRITTIAIAALIVVQLTTLSKVSALQQELQNTRNQLLSESSSIRNEVSGIYSNVNNLLEEQTNILDSYDYQFGEFNKEMLTVPVNFTIFPKQLSDSETAILYINGQEVLMQRQWTTFLVNVDVNLFDMLEARVVLSDQGVQRSETLVMRRSNLWEQFLPSIYAHFNGHSHHEEGKFVMDGNVILDGKGVGADGIKIESTELVVTRGGEVIDRIAPDDLSDKYGEEIAEMRDFLMQEFTVEESYSLEAGQTLRFTIVAYDSLGLIHNIVVNEVEINPTGDGVVYLEESRGHGQEIITDSQGKVLEGPPDYQMVQ
jgi:hypothetical protein